MACAINSGVAVALLLIQQSVRSGEFEGGVELPVRREKMRRIRESETSKALETSGMEIIILRVVLLVLLRVFAVKCSEILRTQTS